MNTYCGIQTPIFAFGKIDRCPNAERYLPIWIGVYEAEAITIALQEVEVARPLTHDLMKNIIGALGADLSDIVIDELRDGTFYAKLNIDNQQIDSRPSDAIALAVRYGVQIFVAAAVMDEAAFIPEEEEEEQQQAPPAKRQPKQKGPTSPTTKQAKLEGLHQQLKEAIEKENYARAAMLRDEIRTLEMRD